MSRRSKRNSGLKDAQIPDIPRSLVINSLFDHNLPFHPRGFWLSPCSVCIQHAFDLHPAPCECLCVCTVCFFSSGLGVNTSLFGCIGPCGYACFSAIFWVVKQEGEPDHVPWWHALTMSILLPEICLTGTAGRGSQACVASPRLPRCSVLFWERWDAAIPW